LEKLGLKTSIEFDPNYSIKEQIEEKLSPHLDNEEWIFYRCIKAKLVPATDVVVVDCRFEDLKGYGKNIYKLYRLKKNYC
jgi:hypothetical protein